MIIEVWFQGKWRTAIYLADIPVPEGKIVAEPIGWNCAVEFELSQWRLTDRTTGELCEKQ